MASVITKDGSASEEAFFNYVVIPHNPIWKQIWNKSDDSIKKMLQKQVRSGALQMSNILEQTVTAVSSKVCKKPLINVNLDGMDFDDGSDLKSFSIKYRSNGSDGSLALKGSISGLKNKKGAIRAICWDEYNKQIYYYFIPAKYIPSLTDSKNNKIECTAPTKGDANGIIKKLERFKCESFIELCKLR